MIVSTIESIPNKEIEQVIGLVKGNTIKSRNIGFDILASFKTLVGGEIKSYTEMISEARNEAVERMKEEAKNLNADAVLGIRFSTTSIMAGASEIMVYGTAVRLK